jgi:hypothetical protein
MIRNIILYYYFFQKTSSPGLSLESLKRQFFKHNEFIQIYLHSLTAATPRSTIMFMRRAVLLDPKRMSPIFNKTSRVCWNLSKDIYSEKQP